MITFSKFGSYGRLGNQLFQYASMIGIAKKYNTSVVLPKCDFAEYLAHPPAISPDWLRFIPFAEKAYTFNIEQFEAAKALNIDITGWLQSEKYWEHCKEDVREALEFKSNVTMLQFSKYSDKPTIAISIRRGDYVDNPNYELLNADYYYLALFEHFPDWRDYKILIFSDDIPYCKLHFQCLPNVYFVEGLNPMEQLILGSMCDNFIIANSTFSWWMAYLGEKPHSKIIRPNYLFAGDLLKNNDWSDFYPERWAVFEHKEKYLEMGDVTFTTPVTIDSQDRQENKEAITAYIERHYTAYLQVGSPVRNGKFHRTHWLNVAAELSTTPIVINYDCDILVPPLQIFMAVEMLRNNEADMVYPYDGRFARVPRTWMPKVQKYNDVGIFKDTEFVGCRKGDAPSVGGVVAYRKDKFIESGGENEKMVSYAPEDTERFYRWNKLGYRVARIKGCCYHLDHVITTNSSTQHPDYKNNERELNYVMSLTETELRDYVQTWVYFQL